METQLDQPTPNDSALQEPRNTKVPLPHPSPTPVPPTYGTTPTSTGAVLCTHSDAVLSPISADLPVSKAQPTAESTTASSPPETAVNVGKEKRRDTVASEDTAQQGHVTRLDDKMAAIRPGFKPYAVTSNTFCTTFAPKVSTVGQPALLSGVVSASTPSVKCGPLSPEVGSLKLGSEEPTVKRVSPTLRVVSPNSVPVKKRSAFRTETDSAYKNRCIQQVNDLQRTENANKLLQSESSLSNFDQSHSLKQGNESEISPKNVSKKDPHDSGSTSTKNSCILQMDQTSLPPIKRAKLLQENRSPPIAVRQAQETTSQLVHDAVATDKRDVTGNTCERVMTQTSPSSNTTKKEESPLFTGSSLNVSTPVGTNAESTSPVQTSNDANQHGTLKAVETTGGKTNQTGGNSTESSSKSPSGRLLYGPAPASQSGYPPLYLPSSCQVTLGRESNRVPKDGSKVHATTFVPDLGEFIPGPASSTREPPSRITRSGPLGSDGQVMGMKVLESPPVKGNVLIKNGATKDNKKGGRHAGHVEHIPAKAMKREGKKSPSNGGDRTSSKMVSPSGGVKMADTKPDRRTDGFVGVDTSKKMRDLGHGVTTNPNPGVKAGDLSIVTHPYGYQPLLSVGGSPPGQKSSSVSPRDRKNTELRGGSELTSKQRQMLDWHMAAASQHGIFYEAAPMWSSPGFGTARTSMITPHSSSVSTQESVLRSALLHGGGHKQHHDSSSHTTAAMTSPKMTVTEAPHKVEPVDVTKLKREELKKPQIGKLNFNDLSSGRGTPSSRTGDGTPTRNPPVGIALVQQRQDTERKTDSRGSTGSNQRDRTDDRRHRDSSRTTFSPHRDARATDSHREHRSSSNPSHVSPHNPNLAVTGGSSIGTHAQDYLPHHGPFPSFPSCFPRFPAGHHSPSQPLWLHQPFAVPTAHGPTSSSYQDVPLPGNVGLQGRDSVSSRQVMMFPPHLSASEGALHGLSAWPSPYLLPAPLHPQLGSLNPSLYAQFAHVPQGGSSIPQPLHLLSGQSESHPAVGSELHTLLQQQEALYHWYRAAEIHSRHGTFSPMSHGDATHPPAHHGMDRSRKQSGGRKSAESKTEPEKKQLKTEGPPQEVCGRTSREVVEEKVTHTAPPIIPQFLPVTPGPAMPLFYPSHPIPYLLDPTKRPLVPSHSQSPTTNVEKKDAGTSSHSPAGRPSSRDRSKVQDSDAKPPDSSLQTACVQTIHTDNVTNSKEDINAKCQEELDIKTVEQKDAETVITDKVEGCDKEIVRDEVSKPKEEELIDVEKLPSVGESAAEQTENAILEVTEKEEKVVEIICEKENKVEETNDGQDSKTTVDKGNQAEGTVDTVQSSDSESWLSSYSSCLDGQRRESLISSIMTTTQSVASRIDAVDQEQLAAIEGIALLSEVAEQKTFEAICHRKDEPPEVAFDDGATKLQEPTSTKEDDDKDVSCLEPPKDLPVSINTEEMKINQLVELQRKYKEKKKEYDKLQRKKDKKEKNDKSGEQTKKRGPGRPRKRKNSQRGKKSSESSEKRETQPSILQSSADVLLEAAASLEEPTIPTKKRKKDKKEKKSRLKKETDDISRGEMSASSIQSSADVLLEAAASLEQPPISSKKKKKEKKDKKTKLKRDSLGETTLKDVKDSKKKKKKLSKRKEGEVSVSENKSKKKTKHSLSSSELPWSSSSLSGLSALGKKKLTTKNGEKKKKHSKVKSSLLQSLPEGVDLPAPVGASLPMYGEQKYKLSGVYGYSSDSDDDESSHCSFDVAPKGLALLASTAELSSGHSTPVKKPSKKDKTITKRQSKAKSEETGTKKRSLSEDSTSVSKKLKLSKKKERGKIQKTLKRERKLIKKSAQKAAAINELSPGNITPPKFDAESWSRRRSERIFLSDTSPQQSRDVSPLSKPSEGGKAKMRLDMGSKSKVEPPALSPGLSNIGTVLDALKTDPFQMRQKFSQMSESDDDDDDDEDEISDSESQNSKIRVKVRGRSGKDKLNTLLMNDVSATSDSSNSEAEDMPLSSLVPDNSDPGPRICNLRKEDLAEGQRVLVPFDNLFYEGKTHPIRPPDVYGVVFESRRGNRPHVFSQEQILQEVIADVKPHSVKYLPEGTRICAYWSQQFNCLYPGTVVKGSPNPSGEKKMVSVEFDDGDSGRIPLSHVRMLPQDYPIISDLGSSSIPLERRLRQRNTEMGSAQDDMKEEDDTRNRRRRGPKTKSGGSKIRKKKELPEMGDDEVFLPNSTPVVKSPRGRKPKVKPEAKNTKPAIVASQGGPVKKGRGRPRKIRPEETIGEPPKKGRPPKKPLSGSVTMAKKINKFYAGRKKVIQAKLTKPVKGTRPRGRPPGSKKGKKKSKIATGKKKSVYSPDILDPAQAAMLRYNGPDDSEDAGTIVEGDVWSQDEEEVPSKKSKGSKSSKIPAFLPERQLWRWLGNATQRKGSKGKAKKVFYKAIVRGKEVIRVNECAVFLSTGRPHLPYIGRIESMWESWGSIMVVRVKWFYHPEETKGCAANIEGKMALYQSSHVDENDIQTISHKCEVLSREEYKLSAMGKIPKNSVIDNEDIYYLAGTYDPTTGRMSTFQ